MNVVALFPDRPRENGDLVFALHLVAAPPRSIVRPLHSMLLMLLLRFGFVLRCCIAMGQISAAAVAAANPDRSPEPTARGGCDSAL